MGTTIEGIRASMIIEALYLNKTLTREWLEMQENDVLIAHIHPTSRDKFLYKLKELNMIK